MASKKVLLNNAHYRAHGYHPLYAFEGKTGYCFNAQLRPGNRYCSEEADSFITPVLERFNQLLFRMDSGFATPKLYDLIEKTGQYYLIKLKKNTVLSRLGDLSLPCPQDEDLTNLAPLRLLRNSLSSRILVAQASCLPVL
ncbi:transposase-like protein%2C IS1380 ISSpn5 [Streptococcus pneumoniae]|nr:transposase-like protein%2C IS1380 ISSpn5 [Streptococcus pneumoniae]